MWQVVSAITLLQADCGRQAAVRGRDPTLRRLVAGGLLTREEVGRGRRATYSLTEAAIELVPVMAALGSWGLRHRPTTATLRVRAELLADGGPELWADFMDELRAEHLGAPSPPDDRPRATERLAAAYAEAVAARGDLSRVAHSRRSS